ncbi:MAG TPA: hypothetical protein VFM99_04730 [Chitinophagales bacterium]|nr:hypothetical protein [Chitinophagales bacterium]
MNHTISKNKKLFLIGAIFILGLTAFKYISGSTIINKSNATQTAGFNPRVEYIPNEPCVAEQFKQRLPENSGYKPIKWSKANSINSIKGADSVIVHGFRMVDSKGTSTIYTKLIYFNTNCEVIFVE